METATSTKSIFSSKTFWFGVAQIIFGITGLGTGWIDSQTALTLIFTGLATVGLRKTTTQGVHVLK